MEIEWLDPENPSKGSIDGAAALIEAYRAIDTPEMPSPLAPTLAAIFRYGWDGDPPVAGVLRDTRGRVIGLAELWLPTYDNTNAGDIAVIVDPARRREGLGTSLFQAGVERFKAEGRTLLWTSTYDHPGNIAFAEAMGLERVSVEMSRRQDLTAIDWDKLAAGHAEAAVRASGYELVRLIGRVPDAMLADVATMVAAINDAPTDGYEVEDEVYTPERIRAFEDTQERWGRRLYRVVARHRETGALAGNTVIMVDANRPARAYQLDTSVLSAHRGHRLGYLLKAEMMRWISEVEPQVRMVNTTNAESNSFMIGVNEELGYRVVARSIGWQKRL